MYQRQFWQRLEWAKLWERINCGNLICELHLSPIFPSCLIWQQSCLVMLINDGLMEFSRGTIGQHTSCQRVIINMIKPAHRESFCGKLHFRCTSCNQNKSNSMYVYPQLSNYPWLTFGSVVWCRVVGRPHRASVKKITNIYAQIDN